MKSYDLRLREMDRIAKSFSLKGLGFNYDFYESEKENLNRIHASVIFPIDQQTVYVNFAGPIRSTTVYRLNGVVFFVDFKTHTIATCPFDCSECLHLKDKIYESVEFRLNKCKEAVSIKAIHGHNSIGHYSIWTRDFMIDNRRLGLLVINSGT